MSARIRLAVADTPGLMGGEATVAAAAFGLAAGVAAPSVAPLVAAPDVDVVVPEVPGWLDCARRGTVEILQTLNQRKLRAMVSRMRWARNFMKSDPSIKWKCLYVIIDGVTVARMVFVTKVQAGSFPSIDS
jgi:hypothetical protein